MPVTVASFTTRSGLKIAADVVGEPRRGSVILAHGGGQTRHSWQSTAERLAERGWKAVSLDLRGHGESGWDPEGDYEMHAFARDVIDVAATLPGRPALIGASLGGLAGLTAEAIEAPGVFSSLTLVDIIPLTDTEGSSKITGFMAANAEHGFASLEEAADVIAAYLPHRKRPKDLSGLNKNLRLGEDGRYRWHWDPNFLRMMRPDRPRVNRADLAVAARGIEIPVHLIRGRMSELVSQEAGQAFIATLKHGSFTDVADAGHMVAGDRNDVFFDAVCDFLDRQSGPNRR